MYMEKSATHALPSYGCAGCSLSSASAVAPTQQLFICYQCSLLNQTSHTSSFNHAVVLTAYDIMNELSWFTFGVSWVDSFIIFIIKMIAQQPMQLFWRGLYCHIGFVLLFSAWTWYSDAKRRRDTTTAMVKARTAKLASLPASFDAVVNRITPLDDNDDEESLFNTHLGNKRRLTTSNHT